MTRTKTTAESSTERDAEVASVTVLPQGQDDSHGSDQQSDESIRTGQASYSLGGLDQHLQQLQSKWQAVEQDLRDRDQAIAALEQESRKYQGTIAALEAELAEANSDDAAHRESLASAQSDIRKLQTEVDGQKQTVLAKDSALAKAKNDNAALTRQLSQLQDEVDRLESDAANTNVLAAEMKSENIALRASVQELKDYIDGRKLDWSNLNDKIKQYQDTIEGMGESLENHDKIVAEKEEEKAALANKVMELERSLSELRGRHSEKESSHSELQQTLEEQSRELGGLNSEKTKLRKEIDKLRKKLERRDATAASLRKDLKSLNRDSTSFENRLAGEKAAIEELHGQLGVANGRIADLESEQQKKVAAIDEMTVTIDELRQRLHQSEPNLSKQELRIAELEKSLRNTQAIEGGLRSEIESSAMQLDEVKAMASEHEIRALELEAKLLEAESVRSDLQEEIDAQRELVQVLENEVDNKQENREYLDRGVDRLSANDSGVRAPDEKIESPRHKAGGEVIQHMIVVENPQTGGEARYPIYPKGITIGRSSENDILINSKYISRVHARIKIVGSNVIIEDAGSTNGFSVNSVHTTRHTLKSGDRLQIGAKKLTYLNLASETGLAEIASS